jgi:hypothetical protein
MTLQEFKAWFEGFTENMGEAPPTKLQWARIQARVKEIDGAVTTYPVFVDRYWPHHPPSYPWVWTCGNTAGAVQTVTAPPAVSVFNTTDIGFNSTQAMTSLGQADYAAVQ